MDTKLFLTISAIIAILPGVGFVLIPAEMVNLYGVPPEPHAILNLHLFVALLAWGVITWFARDLDWAAVRGVLIGGMVGDVVGGLLSVWAIVEGLVNAFGWTSVVIYVLFSVVSIFCQLARASRPEHICGAGV